MLSTVCIACISGEYPVCFGCGFRARPVSELGQPKWLRGLPAGKGRPGVRFLPVGFPWRAFQLAIFPAQNFRDEHAFPGMDGHFLAGQPRGLGLACAQ